MNMTPVNPHLVQADIQPERQPPHSSASRSTEDKPAVKLSRSGSRQSSYLSSSSKRPVETNRRQSRRPSSSKSMSYGKPGDSSRSNSPATMPGLVSTDCEVTYTKKTGRISKAKKGKKVHRCEFPDCGKVYSRAEHRKRHEANHKEEPLYRCEFEGCRKPFHRADLLTRHLERQHGIRMPHRASSQFSNTTSSLPNSPPAVSTVMVSPYPVPPAFPSTTSPLDSSNIVESTKGGFSQPVQAWGTSMSSGLVPGNPIHGSGIGLIPVHHPSSHSSDGSYSPASDTIPSHTRAYPRYYNAPAQSASHPVEMPVRPYPIPHRNTPDLPPWDGYDIAQPHQNLGVGLEGQFPSHVGSPQLTYDTYEHPVDKLTDKLTTAAHIVLDRFDGSLLRRQFVNAAGMASSQDSMAVIEEENLRHYYECYWKNFDPLFPIIHHPSTISARTEPLLLGSMVAIGAQFSLRPHSKLHSMSIFRLCTILVSATELVTNLSPLSDLQSVFLLEALAMYRSCSSDVHRSPEFDALYNHLLNDGVLLGLDPMVVISQHPNNQTDREALHIARGNWANREARRRILLSAAILDTHRCALFSQHSHISSTEVSRLPTPCPQEVWNCVDLVEWYSLVSCNQLPTPKTSPNSPFETSLLQCRSFHYGTLDRLSPNELTHHALLLASFTPISSLIAVAAETWLFGRKLDDLTLWTAAQEEFRRWISSDEASKATWHAMQFLRGYFGRERESSPTIGLHEHWCLYLAALVCWAYGYPRVFPTNVQTNPSLTLCELEMLMWEYLGKTDTGRDWTSVRVLRKIGQTRGVLACVRARICAGGGEARGKLLGEAAEVLWKLGEVRGKLCTF